MTDCTDEDEWTVDGFLADVDRVHDNPPPAPPGLELVKCEAQPRHWPTYVAHVEGMYPAPCMYCVSADQSRTIAEAKCRREHRRWKAWRVWWRLASRLYVLGITSSGGGVSYGRCKFCGVTRQHTPPHWKGRRSYILGKPREWWTCLRSGHRYSPMDGHTFALCTVCLPCPDCGSTAQDHYTCGGAA